MKLYTKNGEIKTRRQIVIKKDGTVTYNPTEEMVLADGWVEYIAPVYELTEEEIINREKENKIEEILRHDSSMEVNAFYIDGQEMWLDKATRVGLKCRFEAEKARSLTDTMLWYNGVQFSLNIEQAIQMLYSLELYASRCYDNTQRHLSEIENLKTIEELQNYNYTTGYPEKLQFNF